MLKFQSILGFELIKSQVAKGILSTSFSTAELEIQSKELALNKKRRIWTYFIVKFLETKYLGRVWKLNNFTSHIIIEYIDSASIARW